MSEWSRKINEEDEHLYVRMSIYDLKVLDRYIDSAIIHHTAEDGDHSQDLEFYECKDRLKTIREMVDDVWALNQESIAHQRKKRNDAWLR